MKKKGLTKQDQKVQQSLRRRNQLVLASLILLLSHLLRQKRTLNHRKSVQKMKGKKTKGLLSLLAQ